MYRIIRGKRLLAGVAVLTAMTVAVVSIAAGDTPAVSVAAGADNWGLHFTAEGQTPAGNASGDTLAQYGAYYVGDTGQKTVYLTFDAGYENGYTAPILDALKKHKAPAAFFVVGHYLESAPELVRRMVAEGHTVANHTYHHPDMSAIADEAAFRQELAAVEDAYTAVTGQTMAKIYRPPQGKYSTANLSLAHQMGYKTVFWSLAYVDWYVDKQPTKEQAFDKLISRIHPGAVVLLHSTSATNAAILDDLLTQWENMGYSFGSITDLVTDKTAVAGTY